MRRQKGNIFVDDGRVVLYAEPWLALKEDRWLYSEYSKWRLFAFAYVVVDTCVLRGKSRLRTPSVPSAVIFNSRQEVLDLLDTKINTQKSRCMRIFFVTMRSV